VSLYDPERDPVRRAGWWVRWAGVPLALGVFVSGNLNVHDLPLIGQERVSAVLFLDGQAYFGHLDESGENGTLVLRDVYYFQAANGGTTGLPVGLVRRGSEAHEPADGMHINRDRVLAVETVGLNSPVGRAIEVEREIARVSPGPVALNRVTVAGSVDLTAQRVATEHNVQRGFAAAIDQLDKINALVLPITPGEAQTITQKAVTDLRTVRRNALGAVATAIGMSASDADVYVRTTDAALEGQSFANDAGVLLAPDLNGIVTRATQLYGQVGDTYAKQLTQPRSASPAPSPSASPSPGPSSSPSPRP
jgi:hypothetical protein